MVAHSLGGWVARGLRMRREGISSGGHGMWKGFESPCCVDCAGSASGSGKMESRLSRGEQGRSGRRAQDLDSRLRSWGFVLREKPRQHFKQETRLLFGESLWTGVWGMGYWGALQGAQGAGGVGRAGSWEEGHSGGSICRPGDWLSCAEGPGLPAGSPGKWWRPL